MIKVAIFAIIAVFLAVQFKQSKSEFSVYLCGIAAVIIFYMGLDKLEIILAAIRKIESYLSINQVYLTILIKIIGITYISEFTSSICKDAGYLALAGQIELVGKLTVMAISMPILLSLLDTMNHFLTA